MDSLIQKSLQFYFPPIFFHGIRGKFHKAFITVSVRDSSYSAQLDHDTIVYMQHSLLLKITFIFKRKIGSRNFVFQIENRS